MKAERTLLLTTATLALASSANAVTLFADTFDRADSADLNADAAGKSGTLGALDWVSVTNQTGFAVANNELVGGDDLAGGGYDVAYVNHNFTDAIITSGGTFSVLVDLVGFNGGSGGTRFMGIAVGHSQSELDGWTANNPASFTSDFFIGIDQTGATRLAIYENAVAQPDVPFSIGAGGQTMRVDFTNVTDFNAGTTISYEAFIDTTSVGTGTFDWSGTNENYLGLYANVSQSGAVLDNFEVTAVPEPTSLGFLAFAGLSLIRRRSR